MPKASSVTCAVCSRSASSCCTFTIILSKNSVPLRLTTSAGMTNSPSDNLASIASSVGPPGPSISPPSAINGIAAAPIVATEPNISPPAAFLFDWFAAAVSALEPIALPHASNAALPCPYNSPASCPYVGIALAPAAKLLFPCVSRPRPWFMVPCSSAMPVCSTLRRASVAAPAFAFASSIRTPTSRAWFLV